VRSTNRASKKIKFTPRLLTHIFPKQKNKKHFHSEKKLRSILKIQCKKTGSTMGITAIGMCRGSSFFFPASSAGKKKSRSEAEPEAARPAGSAQIKICTHYRKIPPKKLLFPLLFIFNINPQTKAELFPENPV
jgi:hypothetical protein